jgi:hypothetical protein
MPALVLRSQLCTFARQAAGFDVTGTSPDEFINDPELLGMVDRSATALYDLLVKARGEEYYLSEVTILVSPLAPSPTIYALPPDFYQLIGVHVRATGFVGFVAIDPFMEREVAALKTIGVIGTAFPQQTKYRLRGVQGVPGTPPGNPPVALIEFLPPPRVDFPAFVRYLPTCVRAVVGPDLVTPDVAYDGINGWEEFIIWDVAAKMVTKEERDAAPYLMQRAMVEKRIEALAGARNAGEPERVVDTRDWMRRAAAGPIMGIRRRLWIP